MPGVNYTLTVHLRGLLDYGVFSSAGHGPVRQHVEELLLSVNYTSPYFRDWWHPIVSANKITSTSVGIAVTTSL